MTETDEKPEEKKPAKQGLHGWKAAFAVFGCGSLAAFGIFGVLVVIATTFMNTFASGVDSEEGDLAVTDQSGSPRGELRPDAIDMCGDYLEKMSDVDIEEQMSGTYYNQDLEEDISSEDRWEVSGECEFSVNPQLSDSLLWYFDFEFEALIHDPEASRDEQALEEYQATVEDTEGSFDGSVQSTEHDWTSPDWQGSVTSFYDPGDGSPSSYTVIALSRSAVYVSEFSGDPSQPDEGVISEDDFEREARVLIQRLDDRFARNIPE